jgi:ribonuclease D
MQRTFKGRQVDRTVSPWLRDLAEHCNPAEADPDRPDDPAAATADWRVHLAEQRALLGNLKPVLSPELTALVGWREEAARIARVAPTSVLDDDLLETVAQRRPSDLDDLAAIPGMGPLLVARVGDGLLAALHAVTAAPT